MWSMDYYSNDPHRWQAGQRLHISGQLYVTGATDVQAQLDFRVQWLAADHTVTDYTDVVEIESLPTAEFVRYGGVVIIPSGTVYWRIYVGVSPKTSGGADGASIYATQMSGMHCRGVATYPDWADGATDDWRWLEEPHQNWAFRVGAEAPGVLADPGAAIDWGVNLIANPRAHVDVSGWADATPVRVISVPFGDLPDGVDAALQIDADGTTSSEQTIDGTRERLLAVCLQWAGTSTNVDATAARLYLAVQFYYDSEADWGSECAFCGHTSTVDDYGSGWAWIEGDLDEWHAFSDLIYCPVGVSKVRIYVCIRSDGSSAALDTGYVTAARIGGATYADGDSSGWEWDDTAHNSVSRRA